MNLIHENGFLQLVSDRGNRGYIVYDNEDDEEIGEEIGGELCVVIASHMRVHDGDEEKDGTAPNKNGYYILVVKPTSIDGEYRRVGMGSIPSECVVGKRPNIRIV